MRWLVLAVAAAGGFAQTFQVTPASVRQGEVLRLTGPAESARMNGRTVRLYPQAGGERLGLMPVAVSDRTGAAKLEFLGKDGTVVHTAALTILDGRFRSQNVVVTKAVAGLKPAPGESETVGAFRKTVSDVRYWQEPFARPVPGCVVSPFGVKRLINGKPTGSFHTGIDQRGAAGHPVAAIADGRVTIVRMFQLHGGTVAIDHGQGVGSIYLHLSKFATKEGAAVKKGEVIGYVGSTGRSSAPHLHWGLYVNEVPVNPRQWIPLRACGARK
ncbi:MAG: M23 family metallopeptidase [Acidobacteriota bacterium]